MKNEVAVVTGVGPGLGAALVKRFANEGFTTIAVARRDLFDGPSQLLVYHFMLPPGSEHICGGCSFLADHVCRE